MSQNLQQRLSVLPVFTQKQRGQSKTQVRNFTLVCLKLMYLTGNHINNTNEVENFKHTSCSLSIMIVKYHSGTEYDMCLIFNH